MKNSALPLVSVIMPVYNTKEEYLRESIDSILAQTYKKFELIIVDDCSTQPVEPIIQSYHDSRIKFKRLPKNSGASVARNTGFYFSRGDLIAVQDSDDVSYPERLAVQVGYMNKYHNIGVLGAAYNIIGADKETVVSKFGSPEYLKAYALFVNSPFGHSTVMMRRSILQETMIHYDRSVICDDYKLWIDLMNRTHFMNIPRTLVGYRWHENNISHRQAEQLMDDVWNIRIKIWKDDLKLSESNADLVKKLMKDEPLSLTEIRKACNIFKSIVLYYSKKYNNPRMAEMAARVLNNVYSKYRKPRKTFLFFKEKAGHLIDNTEYRFKFRKFKERQIEKACCFNRVR